MTELEQFTIEEAIVIATVMHHGQKDREGREYISHPMRVSRSVRLRHDPTLRVAAILHDVVEDTDMDEVTLYTNFPDSAAIILTVTRRKGETYTEFIARVAKDPRARLVKLADLDDNTSEARAAGLTPSLRKRYQAAYLALGETPTF